MHDYQKRSSSPNLAALQAYQRKLAADKASSRFGSPIPTNNPEPTNLTGKKRLLPSQMLEARMMARMQQANAVDSTDGEQEVQGKGDWQQKADLNAIFSNGSTLSSGLMAKYENLMPGVSLGQVSLHQGSQVDAALQTAGLHGLTDGTNVAVASTAPSGTLEHELGHVGQRQEQGFSLDEGNRQAHEKDADEIAGKLLASQPVERFEQTASAKKGLLPSQMLEARMMQQMQQSTSELMSKDIATSAARGRLLQQQPKLLGASQGTEQQQQRFPQGKSSTDQRTPQADGDLYAIVDGGVITIPLAVGTILVVVGVTGIIINWKDISGTLTQLGQITVDWVNDTVSDVTTRIINLVSRVTGASRNILEGAREAIEGVVSQVFEARRGKTPKNNQAQNDQFDDAVRKIEKIIGRKLKDKEIRRLHEAISGEGYGFHEIVDLGVAMFGDPEHQSEVDEDDYD